MWTSGMFAPPDPNCEREPESEQAGEGKQEQQRHQDEPREGLIFECCVVPTPIGAFPLCDGLSIHKDGFKLAERIEGSKSSGDN